jgi:predicted amidohydrolase YtcJ
MCRSSIGDVFGIEALYRSQISRGGFLAASAAGIAAMGIPSREVSAATQSATVFYGGTIVTMDDRFGNADAVAISGNTILAAGSVDQATRAAGLGSRKVNLDGRTLMPGLIDPHQHPIPGGIMLTQMMNVGYDAYKMKAEVLAALRAKAAGLATGQWIYAGYYDNFLPGGYLSMAELDGVACRSRRRSSE